MTQLRPRDVVPGLLPAAAAVAAQLAGASAWLVIALATASGLLMAVYGLRRHRPTTTAPWLVLVGALGSWLAADVVALTSGVIGQGGPAAIMLRVLGYLLLATALYGVAHHRAGTDLIAAVDASIMTVAAGLIVVVLFVENALRAGHGQPAWAVAAVSVSLLVLVSQLGYLGGAPVNRGRSSRMLVLGALVVAVGEGFVNNATVTNGELDLPVGARVCLSLGPLLLGAAMLSRSMRALTQPHPTGTVQTGVVQILVLMVAALAGPGLVAVQLASGGQLRLWEALVESAVVIALAMARTWLMVRDLRYHADLLERLADTDPVTGLGNRRRLVAELGAALDRATPHGALVLLDVERFTELRDSLGSRIADALLREVADRLVRVSGPEATVTRLGSALFGVLLPEVRTDSHAISTARAMLAAHTAPLDLEALTLEVVTSAGVVLVPQDGRTAADLLGRAEVALTVAAEREVRVARFGEQMAGRSAAAPMLVTDLPAAIDGHELVALFQPQVDLATGRVVAVEALVRWQHREHGLLGPAAFVPAAERTGLIGRVTRTVLDQALARCARWHEEGMPITVAVNLSAHDLLDAGLVGDVETLLDRHGVPGSWLELEVTETMAMVDPRRAAATMAGLAALGITLSVDDFGTGHSSLAYLQRLPVRRLKIDRSFVRGLTADQASRAIVASTIDLAHRLGLVVVAEGVEDDATRADLVALGCDAAQGFGLGRPVPAEQVAEQVAGIERRLARTTSPVPAPHAAPGPVDPQ